MMNLLCAPDPNGGVFIGVVIGGIAASAWNIFYGKMRYITIKVIVGIGALIGAFMAGAIETIVIYFFRLC